MGESVAGGLGGWLRYTNGIDGCGLSKRQFSLSPNLSLHETQRLEVPRVCVHVLQILRVQRARALFFCTFVLFFVSLPRNLHTHNPQQ